MKNESTETHFQFLSGILFMDSNCFSRSQKLIDLAQRLRDHKHVSSVTDDPTSDESSPSQSLKKQNRAGVLICVFESENDLRVILTKRSSKLSSYSGEVALPGGRTDEGDADDIQTALREAEEEIGLDPSLVDVVTVLEPFTTKRNVTVVPVVGILWDKKAFNAVPNAEEVEAIFDAPLEMFLKDENRQEEEKEFQGEKYLLHYFEHDVSDKKYVIWALTAGILIAAASLIYQRPPAFQERTPKFWKRNQCRF